MKKLLSLLLIVMVALTSVYANGGQETETATQTVDVTGLEPISEYPITDGEPITLTWWIPLNPSVAKHISNYDENIAIQEIEKRTGVDIKFIHPVAGQELEQFNIMMASGEYPDIIAMAGAYKGGIFQGVTDGVYRDLTDLIPIYAPDYYKVIKDHPDFEREITDLNGKIASFHAYKVPGDPAFRRMMIREDVLEKTGLDIPITIADYEELFEALLDLGITPYLLPKNGCEEEFAALFDVFITEGGTKLSRDTEDKVHFASYDPGFKDYLMLMNSWYEKGYISKDFASVTGPQSKVLFDTMKIGVMCDAIVANFNRGMTQGFVVESLPKPRNYEGQPLHYERNDASPKMGQNETIAAISTSCKNPEAALRLLNFFYTEEGAELLNWGVEGVNWNWVDGQRVYNDKMLNNPTMGTEEASYYYKLHFAPKINYPDTQVHANLLKSPESLAIRMKWGDEENVDSYNILPNLQFTEEEQSRIAKLQSELNTYVDEMTLKFIIGAESFDNWDKFIKTQEQLGVQELISIYQTALNRYLAK